LKHELFLKAFCIEKKVSFNPLRRKQPLNFEEIEEKIETNDDTIDRIDRIKQQRKVRYIIK